MRRLVMIVFSQKTYVYSPSTTCEQPRMYTVENPLCRRLFPVVSTFIPPFRERLFPRSVNVYSPVPPTFIPPTGNKRLLPRCVDVHSPVASTFIPRYVDVYSPDDVYSPRRVDVNSPLCRRLFPVVSTFIPRCVDVCSPVP